MFHHVLIYMVDLHLVLPAMNLSILDAGILIMVQQVRLMMFTLNMVDYPMSFLSMSTFFWWTSREDHSKMFLLFEFCCETPPSCLKVRGWVEPESMWWSQSLCGGLQHFSVSPRPLLSLLGLAWGWPYGVWGLRVWGQGLTIRKIASFIINVSNRVKKLTSE